MDCETKTKKKTALQSNGILLPNELTSKMFLSGPMTGYDDFNFPLFNHVAAELRERGFEVVNPVDICKKFKKESVLSSKETFNKMIAMQQEAEQTCDTIVLLPGWEKSRGVRLELKTAIEKDMKIILWRD